MRKILDKKFWSHGTHLGSVRALSPKALPKIFPHLLFWVVLMVPEVPLVAVFNVGFEFTKHHSIHQWRAKSNGPFSIQNKA